MMAVYAPNSSKSLEMYEACISSVLRVLPEGRCGGAKDFYITGDLNVELGLHETQDRAQKPEHTAATPSEPTVSRGGSVLRKRSIRGKR